jgi:hypothetical protein
MGTIQGTIAGDANVGLTLRAAIEAEMAAVGWVFVTEVVAASTVTRAWRSPAAINSLGTDFIVTLRVTNQAATGWHYLFMGLTEGVSGTNAVRPATNAWSTQVPASDGSNPNTPAISGGQLFEWSFNLSTVSFRYLVRVTPDYVLLGGSSSGSVHAPQFAGAYVPAMVLENDLPLINALVLTTVSGTGVAYGAFTRIPYRIGLTGLMGQWLACIAPMFALPNPGTQAAPNLGVAQPCLGGAATFATATPFGVAPANSSSLGYYRGQLSSDLVRIAGNAHGALGDTIVVDGVTYISLSSGNAWVKA